MSLLQVGRRGFLRTACRHCVGFAGLGLAGEAIGQPQAPALDMPARFTRPALDSDEGGLWAMMDREEARVRRSSFVVRDEALVAYLQGLVCKLGGDHCIDVRVHVVRNAYFNASMAPNGMLQVWSGLLLRVDNEAQLAAVLGHELGHYLERHTLERMRDLKGRSALAAFMAVFGLAGSLASLGVLAGAYAFSREQEQRADRIGMQLLLSAGYDGSQAAQVWDNLLEELRVTGGEEAGKRSPMFATHPPIATRHNDLLSLAGSAAGGLGDGALDGLLARHRIGWLMDEIRRGQFEESVVLFDRLLRRNPQDEQVLFARGEARRLRDQPEDVVAAIDDLTRASEGMRAPVESFRSLGLAHKRRSNVAAAVSAFEKYLALVPGAGDAGLIQTYIAELKP